MGRHRASDRSAEKEKARARDAGDLAAGHVSREELRLRNAFLSGLDIIDSRIECNDEFD
jgi:hypothetical protein